MAFRLANKVALVTGATKGIGKGIALQLGQNGAKVYITGRTLKANDMKQSLEDTQNEIKKRGGECVVIQCDHEDDLQVEELFKKIDKNEKGQLDILVNSAFKGGERIFEKPDARFWEMDPVGTWDDINGVGLRNHYFCTVYASRMMIPRKQGLIVNISSLGGLQYAFNAAYGIGKAAIDRMSQDTGIELKKHNVASIALLLGGVKTEASKAMLEDRGEKAVLKFNPNDLILKEAKLQDVFDDLESVEFSGKVISEMAADPKIMKYTSKVVIAAEYAAAHKIKDIDNRTIPSHRQINSAMKLVLPGPLKFTANFVPDFVKLPQFAFDLMGGKF